MPELTSRPVSNHERLCLVRSRTGFPHPITFLITYPSPSALPTPDFLKQRIEALQILWPHIYTRLEGTNTNAPKWTDGNRPWRGEEIVFEQRIPESCKGSAVAERLLHYDMRTYGEGQMECTGVKPLLRITRYTDTVEGEELGGDASYLGVSINHFIADGVGAAKMMMALLSSDISELEKEERHPPTLESTVEVTPPPLAGVYQSIRDAVSAITPASFTKHVKPPAQIVWPGNRIAAPPSDFEEGLSLCELSPDLVRQVKTAGKAHGVDKLHSILKAAWSAAMFKVLGKEVDPSWVWGIMTPRNERKAAVHPYAMGNYVSRVTLNFTPSDLEPAVSGGEAFWAFAQRISFDLSDPIKQAQGRYAMGAMSSIPNEPNPADEPTAWEKYYLAKREKDAPYTYSAALSNLAYLPLPPHAIDLAWAQPACPLSAAFMISILGTEAGVRWVTTWRDGCAMTKEEVKGVEREFISLLTQAIDRSIESP